MQPEQKAPPPVEKSLNYMSWSIKDLVKEIKDVNVNLQKLVATLEGLQKMMLNKNDTPF